MSSRGHDLDGPARACTVKEPECKAKMQLGTRGRAGFRWLTMALLVVGLLVVDTGGVWKRREDKTKCPKVKGIRNFDISEVWSPSFAIWHGARRIVTAREAEKLQRR